MQHSNAIPTPNGGIVMSEDVATPLLDALAFLLHFLPVFGGIGFVTT